VKNQLLGYKSDWIVVDLDKHLLHQVSEFICKKGVQNNVEKGALLIKILSSVLLFFSLSFTQT
jgi:hypothetical protein